VATIVPERILPAGDPATVVAHRAEPQYVPVIGIEENRQLAAARAPARATPTSKSRRIVVQRGLRYDLGPVLRDAHSPPRQWCEYPGRLKKMAQIDGVVTHALANVYRLNSSR